jgi:hypothetical protein
MDKNEGQLRGELAGVSLRRRAASMRWPVALSISSKRKKMILFFTLILTKGYRGPDSGWAGCVGLLLGQQLGCCVGWKGKPLSFSYFCFSIFWFKFDI